MLIKNINAAPNRCGRQQNGKVVKKNDDYDSNGEEADTR